MLITDTNLEWVSSSEYYFSEDNLQADIYLRQQMTKDGYVPLSLIAGFHRVQSLCNDSQLIHEVMLYYEVMGRSLSLSL
jgi:la-related protein 1